MQNSGLIRRLAAMLYDALLLFALLMLASVPFVVPLGGEDMESTYELIYQLAMAGVIYAYFVGYWVTRGRTLGMQSWGLQIVNKKGQTPSLGQATLRFFAGSISWACLILGFYLLLEDQLVAAAISWVCFGIGFLWQLWDKDTLALHDRLSGTRTVYVPRDKKLKPWQKLTYSR